MKNDNQRCDKKQCDANIGIAPEAEFENSRQCRQYKTGDDPVFKFMH
jgi:hypothetical protein